jgi:hypothetical protein
MTLAATFHIIACWELARGLEVKQPKLEGYAAFYRDSLPTHDRAVLDDYLRLRAEIAADVAARMEVEMRAEASASVKKSDSA